MKKITLLLAFFICLNISLNAQTYPKKENVIRLLTYNTHYCKGGSGPGSIDDYNTRRLASKPSTPTWLPCKNWIAP